MTIIKVNHKRWMYFWETYFLPLGVPLLLAVVMGLVLALMISREYFLLAYGVVFMVPAAILFNRYPLAGVMLWMRPATVPCGMITETSARRTSQSGDGLRSGKRTSTPVARCR